jgi:hypothetical protein
LKLKRILRKIVKAFLTLKYRDMNKKISKRLPNRLFDYNYLSGSFSKELVGVVVLKRELFEQIVICTNTTFLSKLYKLIPDLFM